MKQSNPYAFYQQDEKSKRNFRELFEQTVNKIGSFVTEGLISALQAEGIRLGNREAERAKPQLQAEEIRLGNRAKRQPVDREAEETKRRHEEALKKGNELQTVDTANTLMKEILSEIKSGKYSNETNDALLRCVLDYLATSVNKTEAIEGLKSQAQALKIVEGNTLWRKINNVIRFANDPAYCQKLHNDPKYANYSFNTFKEEVKKAIAYDPAPMLTQFTTEEYRSNRYNL